MSSSRLFTAGTIGNMALKNRLIMAPMGNNYGNADEAVSDRQISYYEERAKGGVGLIITESCPVDQQAIHGRNRMQVYLPGAEKRLKDLTDAIHRHDCRIVLQLTHGGPKCSPELIGEYPVAPSSLPLTKKDYIPRTLSRHEIDDIVQRFVSAARVAEAAHFDGVQILAASGHLVHRFLSPVSNRREDLYGGTTANRARFLVEIVKGIMAALKDDLPVLVKICGDDPEDPGQTRIPGDEMETIVSILDEIGVGSLHFSTNYSPNPEEDRRRILALAASVRKRIRAKVSVAGSIHDSVMAEEVLSGADFVELGRPLLADPDLPLKAASGSLDDIRPCLDCNRCRFETSQKRPIRCVANPYLGREHSDAQETLPTDGKKVAIIGAGPAGLQAAVSLSARGYSGVVFERSSRLGGLLWPASTSPSKDRMKAFASYLTRQFSKTSFKVELNTRIDLENLGDPNLAFSDVVIVASGAVPYVPRWLDLGLENVYLAVDVLAERRSLRGDVVVLGAGQVGCEAADFLSEDPQSRVRIMCTSPVPAKNINRYERTPMLQRLSAKGVRIMVRRSAHSFDGSRLKYEHEGGERTTRCDALVIAKGWESSQEIKDLLEQKHGKKVIVIGDAESPGSMLEALEGGLDAARRIQAEGTTTGGFR